MSEPVSLEVREPGPPRPAAVQVSPARVRQNEPFTVSWPRVVNPGVWTTYKVQVHNHRSFGYGLIWESAETPDISLRYDGPPLPRAGTYHIAVVALDGTYHSISEPVELQVSEGGPPKPAHIELSSPNIVIGNPVTIRWPRVENPGIWTTYRAEIRQHHDFGFSLIWASQPSAELETTYTGTALTEGAYHVVVWALDGTYETMSDPVRLDVYGSEAAP